MIFFYLLILIMPLSTNPFWTAQIGDFTLFKYLGAICVVYAMFHLSVRRRIPDYFQTWQTRLYLFFYAVVTISYFTASRKSAFEVSPFLSYTSFLILLLITGSIVDSIPRLRGSLLAAVASAAYSSLYVIREWQKYHDVYKNFRPGYTVGDSNYYAVSALLSLPLAYYLGFAKRPQVEKIFCLGCLMVTLLGLTVSASRGGFLGLIASFLFVIWRSRQRVRNLLVVILLVVPMALVSPISPLRRLMDPNHSDTEAEDNRTIVWKAGLHMIEAHPLVGVGLGNFKSAVISYEEPGEKKTFIAHNVYIEIAAEMGLPALLVFFAIIICTFQTLERVRRRTIRGGSSFLYQAAIGVQAGLIGYVVSSFFSSEEYQKLFWLMISISTCMPALVKSARQQPAEDSLDLHAPDQLEPPATPSPQLV